MCTEYNDVPVCPHCKHTQRDEEQKKLLQNRLRRIENHIRHCVARDIREGKDEVIDELMGTLKKLMK